MSVLICAAVLTLFASVAVPQPMEEFGRSEQPNRHRPPGGPLMRVIDTDKDGQLSAAEIGNAVEALMTLDENGDGVLSREELRPRHPGRPGMPDGQRPGYGVPEFSED